MYPLYPRTIYAHFQLRNRIQKKNTCLWLIVSNPGITFCLLLQVNPIWYFWGKPVHMWALSGDLTPNHNKTLTLRVPSEMPIFCDWVIFTKSIFVLRNETRSLLLYRALNTSIPPEAERNIIKLFDIDPNTLFYPCRIVKILSGCTSFARLT